MEQVSGFYFPPSETTSAQFSNMTEISASGFNILIRAKRYGRWWILKALAPAVRNSEVYQSLLQKEFDIMKHVQHPGVAEVMGIEEVDGYGKCLVMEWIDGVTLEEWLLQHHSKAERVHIANQLLVVLEFVHDMQVVHRVPVGAEVDLVRLKDLVQADGRPVDVLNVLGPLLLRELRDVIHVPFAGDDHPPRVALLLKEDEFGHRQLADLDAEGVQRLALCAVGAVLVQFFFHD